jgi:hypothetical protein
MGKCCLSNSRGLGAVFRLLGLLVGFWMSAGCAHDNRFTYVRGATPGPLVKAKEPGTYELFPDSSLSPKFSIDLAAGDPYGFRKREDDAIVAVAKDKEIELGDRYAPLYYWLKKTDQQGK